MQEERFRQLLDSYTRDNISVEEEQELFRLIGSPEYHALLESMVQATLEAAPDSGISMSVEQRNAMLTAITGRQQQRRLPFLQPYKWVAAAAIVLLLGAGAYFLLARKPAQQPLTVAVTDLPPAGARAMLTLADGSMVPLDSTGQQVIQQGHATVHQQQGQLQYTPLKGAPGTAGYNVLTTPRGGFFQISLPDGSRVWLNAASSLRYPLAFDGKERRVELQGQAYFEIAADAARPFKVSMPDGAEVQVLGTSFDIMAYADEQQLQTTLLEGAVKITQAATQVVLKPGQQAVLNPASHTLQVQAADVNQVIAWKTGFFEFANTDLTAIMRQIARWYDVEVVYEHQHDKERFLGRISRRQPLSRILELLEENGIHFRVEGRKITVLR